MNFKLALSVPVAVSAIVSLVASSSFGAYPLNDTLNVPNTGSLNSPPSGMYALLESFAPTATVNVDIWPVPVIVTFVPSTAVSDVPTFTACPLSKVILPEPRLTFILLTPPVLETYMMSLTYTSTPFIV
ncbi:Uncharacterised protein [uncultured archaeon]|nr:Uncharacterised protein [uncultured archaeon]